MVFRGPSYHELRATARARKSSILPRESGQILASIIMTSIASFPILFDGPQLPDSIIIQDLMAFAPLLSILSSQPSSADKLGSHGTRSACVALVTLVRQAGGMHLTCCSSRHSDRPPDSPSHRPDPVRLFGSSLLSSAYWSICLHDGATPCNSCRKTRKNNSPNRRSTTGRVAFGTNSEVPTIRHMHPIRRRKLPFREASVRAAAYDTQIHNSPTWSSCICFPSLERRSSVRTSAPGSAEALEGRGCCTDRCFQDNQMDFGYGATHLR